jgi:hypothetical protein
VCVPVNSTPQPCTVTCREGEFLDEASCSCLHGDPTPPPTETSTSPPCMVTCREGEFLDEYSCTCIHGDPCFEQPCPPGEKWDFQQCTCVIIESQN